MNGRNKPDSQDDYSPFPSDAFPEDVFPEDVFPSEVFPREENDEDDS